MPPCRQIPFGVTVAVPTRHRLGSLRVLVDSVLQTSIPPPPILILHDAPEDRRSVHWASKLAALRNIEIPVKQSLAALWNKAIIYSSTNWVLISNDDVVFRTTWLEHLMNASNAANTKQINLCGYSAFCLHKSLIPLMGWFDERFRGGYYEDVDRKSTRLNS